MSNIEVFYEGSEKTLQIHIPLPGRGLLEISFEDWQSILNHVGAKIISTCSTRSINSYLLSESSLFVWKDRVLIKTCGTTTLLSAIQPLRTMIEKLFNGCHISSLFYCHKAFLRPEAQEYPHNSIESEREYLLNYFSTGNWHNFDHHDEHKSKWSVFMFNDKQMTDFDDARIELNMYRLDSTCLGLFSRCTYNDPDKEMGEACEIEKLFKGSLLDGVSFDPYGYSVNGCNEHNYFTIHVTPQNSCSYASFETNENALKSLSACFKMIQLFRPIEFCMTVVCKPGSKDEIDYLMESFTIRQPSKKTKFIETPDYCLYYCFF